MARANGAIMARYFKKDADVEISSNEKGFRGSWYAGTVVRPPGNANKCSTKALVEYKSVTEDEGAMQRLREEVDVVQLRPPPPRENRRSFKFSEEVDAYYDDGWWEGIISEVVEEDKYLVFLRGTREQMAFRTSELRLHREWVFGKWVPPLERSEDVTSRNEMACSKKRKNQEVGQSTRIDSYMPSPTHTTTNNLSSSPIPPNAIVSREISVSHTRDPTIPVIDVASSCSGDSPTTERKFIRPRGKEFTEELTCVQEISEIIYRKYNGVWKSWKKIPEAVRTSWFGEFEKKFRWLESDRWQIRKIFEHRGSETLKNRLHRAHSSNKRPYWIGIEVWNGLLKEWAKDDFKKISAQNKVNRASDCGGKGFPLHKGGCISHLAHKDRLKNKLGYQPGIAEFFKHTHSSLNEKCEPVWVNERAKNTYNLFLAKWNEICSQHVNSSQRLSELQVWTEIVGGMKKGLVYGLGGEASFVPFGLSSFAKPWETSPPWETEQSRPLKVQVKDKKEENIDARPENQMPQDQEEIEDLESRC